MLELQDFVKKTLIEIATGVREAQRSLAEAESDVLINPPTLTAEPVGSSQAADYYTIEQGRVVNLVELEVAVAVSDQGTVVAESRPEATATASRLRFKVGIALPVPNTPTKKGPTSFELEV